MTALEDTPMIDLRYVHAQHVVGGDIAVIMTWNRHTSNGCMVLLPASRLVAPENIVPCIVDESSAWKWSDQIGDPQHQLDVSALFAAALGLPPAMKSINRVRSIIQDHVGDLASIPPMPNWGERHTADIIATGSDGSEIHQEVWDHV